MFAHENAPLQLFLVVWIFLRSLSVICYGRWNLSEGHKNYFKDWCFMNSQRTFPLLTYLNFWIMAILSKACKLHNFESHNSLKLSFTNIWDYCLNFADWESFLEINSPDILALFKTNLDDSIDSGNFSVRVYLPLIRKNSSAHMHGLKSLCERRTSVCTALISRKLCRFLFMFSSGCISLSVLLLFPVSIYHLLFHLT